MGILSRVWQLLGYSYTKMKPSDLLSYTLVRAHHHVSGGKHKLYCVATDKRGNILCDAGNSYTLTHPKMAKAASLVHREHNVFLHSEISCLVKLLRMRIDTKRVTLYIARSNKNGEPMLAAPCPICDRAIRDSGIKNVIYTGGDNGHD